MIAAISTTTGRKLTWNPDEALQGDQDLLETAFQLPGAMATVTGPWVPADWDDPHSVALLLSRAVEINDGPGVILVGDIPKQDYGPGCCDT